MLRTFAIKLRVIKFSDLHIGILLYGVLGIIVVSLVYMRELDFQESLQHSFFIGIEGLTWNLDMNDLAMGGITALMAILLFLYAIFRRWFIKHPLLHKMTVNSVLLVMVMISGLLYLYVARGIAQNTFVKAHDSYHYLLGPKYYKELGYFGLYEATLIADAESEKPFFKENDRIRDLKTYQFVTVANVMKSNPSWRKNFSDDRWEMFKKDIVFYKSISARYLPDILRDHGYNGTPFHAYLAGILSNHWHLDYSAATLLCLFDIVGLLIMMIVFSWAFGWKTTALFAIFYFISFTDRHYYIGGSFFRYYWMITTGIGISFLYRKYYAIGAFMISAAAMLNVFPLLFLVGLSVKIIFQFLREQKLTKDYQRFVFGVVLATIILGALSISHAEGVQNYKTFFDDMGNHTELATRSRIGFRYLFILPQEFKKSIDYGYTEKTKDLESLRNYTVGTGLAILVLILFLTRKRTDIESTIVVGLSALLLLFNTVEYYYGVAGLLIFAWSQRGKYQFILFLSAFFAGMAIIYGVHIKTDSLMICHNYGCTIYFLLFLSLSCILPSSRYNANNTGNCVMSNKDTIRMRQLIPFVKRKPVYILMLTVLLLLLVSVFVYYKISNRKTREATIVFGGDVNLGRRQHIELVKRGKNNLFEDISLLSEADLSIVNLECVVAQGGKLGVNKGEQGPYYYRARPEMLSILESAGIDIVITSNNHSGDYGTDALLEQIGYLDAMNLGYAGSGAQVNEACSPVFRRAGDLTIAVFGIDTTMKYFAATETRPGNCYCSLNEAESVYAKFTPEIKKAREVADLVFIAIHWGSNFKSIPQKEEIAFGHTLIDAGADAILGTSSHLLQGIEVYAGRPIIHDAGNLLFDLSNRNDSGIFELLLNQNGVQEIVFHPLESYHGFTRKPSFQKAKEISTHFAELSQVLNTETRITDDNRVIIEFTPLPERKHISRKETIPDVHILEAPVPNHTPPDEYTVTFDQIPNSALITPATFGPLELLGLEISPKVITQREMLYVTSYWRLAEPIGKIRPGLMLDIRAEPIEEGKRWSGSHEPCDWGWPVERFEKGIVYKDHYGLRPPSLSDINNGSLEITVAILTADREMVSSRRKIKSIPVRLQ